MHGAYFFFQECGRAVRREDCSEEGRRGNGTRTRRSPEQKKGQDDMTTIAAILKQKGYAITTVEPTAHISEVARTLAEHHIGAVLVMDRAEQMLGIISERDIVLSLAANGSRTMEMTAAQLMTRDVHVVRPETSVNEAMQTMTTGRFRHLPVFDRNKLVGLISIGDVVKARIVDADTAVDSLTAYVAGSV
jgi:CBS domain-containing protein